jgi:hypothetical protein
LSTGEKELSFGLEFRKFCFEFSCKCGAKFSDGNVDKLFGKGMGTKRITKESETGGNFWGFIPWIG